MKKKYKQFQPRVGTETGSLVVDTKLYFSDEAKESIKDIIKEVLGEIKSEHK